MDFRHPTPSPQGKPGTRLAMAALCAVRPIASSTSILTQQHRTFGFPELSDDCHVIAVAVRIWRTFPEGVKIGSLANHAVVCTPALCGTKTPSTASACKVMKPGLGHEAVHSFSWMGRPDDLRRRSPTLPQSPRLTADYSSAKPILRWSRCGHPTSEVR